MGKTKLAPQLGRDVEMLPAQPNKMFSEWENHITVFLKYRRGVRCAHCGRKRSVHWTQLVFFRIADLGDFVLSPGDKEYPPLTPVCPDHVLMPDQEALDIYMEHRETLKETEDE